MREAVKRYLRSNVHQIHTQRSVVEATGICQSTVSRACRDLVAQEGLIAIPNAESIVEYHWPKAPQSPIVETIKIPRTMDRKALLERMHGQIDLVGGESESFLEQVLAAIEVGIGNARYVSCGVPVRSR